MDGDDETDEIDEHTWPEELVAVGAVRAWIASALPGRPEVVGPILVHMAKEWGVTASFAVTGAGPAREVVFKACLLPRFAASAARLYPLLDQLVPRRRSARPGDTHTAGRRELAALRRLRGHARR